MISQAKLGSVLYSFTGLLVAAREIARDQGANDLEEILDVAEYLVTLIARRDDLSSEFESQVHRLARRFPRLRFAAERLSEGAPAGWGS